MRNLLIIGALLALSACGKQGVTLPAPPTNTKVVEQKIPVPVLCKVELDRAKTKLDSMETGRPLEEQNAALRESIAQQRSYITMLEAGIIGCGGKIK